MITADTLTKAYGSRKAVDGVSFDVGQGETFGFLGPNGAGKTTTTRMLIGLTPPDGGRAIVAGADPVASPREVHSNIGVVFETPNLYERLTAEDNLILYCKLYGVSSIKAGEMLERLGLGDRRKEAVSKFSKGLKQRVLLGRALLHRPKVLFLDEPTSGLDPSSSLLIRDMVRELKKEGTTIFLTTHYMEEADELCDRVAFINDGHIAAMDTPSALKLKYGEKKMRLEVSDGSGEDGKDGEVKEIILSMEDSASGDVIRRVIQDGKLLTIHSQEATLADVFIKLTGRDLR